MKGLPASGKSTFAKELVDANPGAYKRVNKDDLRSMLDNGKWSRGNEKFVLKIRDQIIRDALSEGKHVIVDDTNLAPKHEQKMREIAKEFENTVVEIEDFTNIPLKVCIQRDLARPNSVGKDVIMAMYNEFLREEIDPISHDPKLPDCWIFDIDGTLAKMHGRSPYDWKRVGEDKLNLPVFRIYSSIIESKKPETKIIIMTGRDGICAPETLQWLQDHGIGYDHFYIRKTEDQRKDAIVKKEIYNEHINGKYNVLGIFDDRTQVVEMWRSLGLPVFQVDEGNF